MSLSGYTVIYGGSFDPPHMSHQMSCLYLLEALQAAHVWIIPTSHHPFGKALVPFAARYAMCELLAQPFGQRVSVLPVEDELGGAGRTYDTLQHLRRLHPEVPMALAIGADILADTHRWHRWDDIAALVPVVVMGRAGYPGPEGALQLPAVASHRLRQRVQSGASLEGLVPASVAAYIARHGLYRAEPAT